MSVDELIRAETQQSVAVFQTLIRKVDLWYVLNLAFHLKEESRKWTLAVYYVVNEN